MFYWFEPVLYLDPVSKFEFPETTERPGYFVGFADNVGDALTFKILKNDLITVLHRSMVRSAADTSHWNRRVSFKSDVQESLTFRIDLSQNEKAIPSSNFFGLQH
jgi:outer membrane protease